MVQTHTIILWSKPDKQDKSFEGIAKDAYGVMNIFQEYPMELRPNYLTAMSLKKTKEFQWNYENFEALLRKGVNREGKNIFEDLGYNVAFFSSKNSRDSSGFLLNVGTKNPRFHNAFIVNLPISFDYYDSKTAGMICNLFGQLVQKYNPYWGCIVNKALFRGKGYERYTMDDVPTMVHWLNYWPEDMAKAVGMDKIQQTLAANPSMRYENGILLARETAFDVDKEEDLLYQERIQKQLLSQ